MAFVRVLQCVLMVVGVMLIAAGLAVMLIFGAKPVHMQYYFTIPQYEFKMIWPGNYTKTISECIDVLIIEDQPTVEPVSSIITTRVPWRNCSDMDAIAVAVCAYELQNYTGTPKLILELYGCSFNESREIVNVDLLELGFVEHNGVYEGKAEIKVEGLNVFEYECLKAALKPIGLVVQTALTVIPITCCIQYEVKQPTLEVVSEKTIWETLTVLENIDFTGLIYGLALVHVGVLLEIPVLALHVRTASRTTSPTIHS